MKLDALHGRRQDQGRGGHRQRNVGPDSEASDRKFGAGRWRTMKGDAMIRLDDGTLLRTELHWFEAHGVARVYFKRKRNLDERS